MTEMASRRLDDLRRSFLLNKNTAERTFAKSMGQPTITAEDAKLLLLTAYANQTMLLSMIKELNDLIVAERKKTFFQRLFKK